MHIQLHVKYSSYLSNFNKTWVFWADFRKIFMYKISWKSVDWETSYSMKTDGRTDRQTDRQTDRYDQANTDSYQFCGRVYKRYQCPVVKSQACNFCIKTNYAFCFRQECWFIVLCPELLPLITGNIRQTAQAFVSHTQFMGKSDMP
jgi:hypothetical protein